MPKDKMLADIAEKAMKAQVLAGPEPVAVERQTLEKYAAWLARCGYEMTEFSVGMLNDYLCGYNLWLCGRVGVGKTFFFECMNRVRKGLGMQPMVFLSMVETQGWTMDMAREWVGDNVGSDVVIDDLGAEPEMSSYGLKAELFPYLLECRIHGFRRTHLTSNLTPSEVLARYQRRVSDRFVQYFKMEEFRAVKSRRKLAPWVKLGKGEVAT